MTFCCCDGLPLSRCSFFLSSFLKWNESMLQEGGGSDKTADRFSCPSKDQIPSILYLFTFFRSRVRGGVDSDQKKKNRMSRSPIPGRTKYRYL